MWGFFNFSIVWLFLSGSGSGSGSAGFRDSFKKTPGVLWWWVISYVIFTGIVEWWFLEKYSVIWVFYL